MKAFLKLFGQVYLIPLIIIITFYFKYSNEKLSDTINKNLHLIIIFSLFFIIYLGFLKEKMISSRYLVNFTPILLLLFGYLIETINKKEVKYAICSVLIIFFISLNILSLSIRINRGLNLELPKIEAGKWLDRNTPKDSSVHVRGIGYIGFYSNRKIYDFELINKPNEKEIIGVLYRGGKLDITEKIKEYGINYIIGDGYLNDGHLNSLLGLRLVYKTKNVNNNDKQPIYIYKVLLK